MSYHCCLRPLGNHNWPTVSTGMASAWAGVMPDHILEDTSICVPDQTSIWISMHRSAYSYWLVVLSILIFPVFGMVGWWPNISATQIISNSVTGRKGKLRWGRLEAQEYLRRQFPSIWCACLYSWFIVWLTPCWVRSLSFLTLTLFSSALSGQKPLWIWNLPTYAGLFHHGLRVKELAKYPKPITVNHCFVMNHVIRIDPPWIHYGCRSRHVVSTVINLSLWTCCWWC